ncbi:MAG: hypothetical protein JEY97_13190 [Bacteroidales bacterium]|nr:hypothetical protein [Bacteroidales bacterium]
MIMNSTFVKTEYVQPIGVTAEANTLSINFSNAMNIYIGTSVFVLKKLQEQEFRKFLRLKDRWKSDTLFVSSSTVMISNSAYKEIISLGSLAIPWIIRELQKANDHWFFALEKITGENPIKTENIGKVEKMKEDWIEWASKNDYV